MVPETLRLLIVDDDPAFLDMLKLMMERLAVVDVKTTTSPRDVPGMLGDGYDVIVSDYEMDEFSGLDLLRAVRERDDIPFILLTGRGREEIAIEALNDGADIYLQKGIHARSMFEELLSHARRLKRDRLRRRELDMAWAIVDRAPEEVYLIDEDGRFEYINRTASEALGYSFDELKGGSIGAIDPDYPTHDYRGQWRTLREHGSYRLLSRHRSKDGRTYPVDVSINLIEIDDREYNCAFARDLTPMTEVLGLGDVKLDGYRTAFLQAPIPMAIVLDGSVNDINKAMMDTLDMTGEGAISMTVPKEAGPFEFHGHDAILSKLEGSGMMLLVIPPFELPFSSIGGIRGWRLSDDPSHQWKGDRRGDQDRAQDEDEGP